MTTHDKDKVLAAAKEAGIHRRSTPIGTTEMFCWEADIESLYAIAHEAGRQAEREEIMAQHLGIKGREIPQVLVDAHRELMKLKRELMNEKL